MQEQAMRSRLSQLKKASIELKSKVYEQPRIEPQTIVDILSNVLPNNFKSYLSFPNTQKINPIENSSNHNKLKSNAEASNLSLNYSANSSVRFPVSTPPNKTEQATWHSSNYSNCSLPLKDVDVQIDRLKSLNEQLQNNLVQIDKQIAELKKIQQIKQQQSWKDHLPFINKQNTVGVFITKISIKQYDYDKIDYDKSKIKLRNDLLTIDALKTFNKQFKMAHLQDIKYITDKSIKLQFKHQQNIYLFLQFQTTQQRNQWDRAFYVNSKIITAKDLDKNLFAEDKDKQPNNSVKSKSKSSLKLSEASQNQNQKDESKLKGSFRLTDRLIQRSNASFASSRKKSEDFKSIVHLEYTLNGASPDSLEPQNSNIHNSSFVSVDSKRQKQIKEFNVFGQPRQSNNMNGSRPNTSRFNNGETNFESVQFYPTFHTEKKEDNSKPAPQNIDTAAQLQKQIQSLKEGFYLVKYAKDGYKPHNKKLLINSQQSELICSNNEDLNDKRIIPIQNIKSVKYPHIGDGIKKHIKNPKPQNYCVIEYDNQGTTKYLQLGCQKVHFIKRFYDYFSNFLKQKGILFTE